jgi:hypothetical protein
MDGAGGPVLRRPERGFVVFLPELPDGTEFAVVARDAAGAEVARQPQLYASVP